LTWSGDHGSDGLDGARSGRSGFSLRAERLLVRVLLLLRREAKPSESARSRQRAEELADLILTTSRAACFPSGSRRL